LPNNYLKTSAIINKNVNSQRIEIILMGKNLGIPIIHYYEVLGSQIEFCPNWRFTNTSSPSDIRRNHHILPSKTTVEYTFYLRQVSSNGSMGECVSVMMPCPWTYLEIAQIMQKSSHAR